MSKKEKTASPQTEETPEGLYYEIENLTMSGTFTNCNIFINTGSPVDPPKDPPGSGNG